MSAPRESAETRPALKRRRGHRVYSGCNTCRLRKIKCDKEQPSCSNCLRSRRYICDGYGDSTDRRRPGNPQTPPASQQSSAVLPPYALSSPASQASSVSPGPILSAPGPPHPGDYNDRRAETDRQESGLGHGHGRGAQGPTSMILDTLQPDLGVAASGLAGSGSLHARSPSPSDSFTASLNALAELQYGVDFVDDVLPWMLQMPQMPQMPQMSQMPLPVPEPQPMHFGIREPMPEPRTVASASAMPALPLPPLPAMSRADAADSALSNGKSNSSDMSMAHPMLFPSMPHARPADKPGRTCAAAVLPHQSQAPQPTQHQLPPQLPEARLSDTVRRLLHHYQTHVSQLMMPTSAPSHNPYLRLYLPMALQSPTTASKECLLYAIVAVAAYNKAELAALRDRDAYRRQALAYKEKADGMIRACISQAESSTHSAHSAHRHPHRKGKPPLDATDRQALLAAALTMTTVEVFSGADEGKGYEDILLCKHIIRLTGGLDWWLSDAASLTLLQIFRCLEIIAYTSGWSYPQDSRSLRPPAAVPKESHRTYDNIRDQSRNYSAEHNSRSECNPSEEHGGRDDNSNDGYDDDNDCGALGDNTAADSLPAAPRAPDTERMAGTMAPAGEYTLDVSFGISMKTLHCLNKIIDLATDRAAATSSSPDSECAKTGDRLWLERSATELRQLEADLFGIMADPDAFDGPQIQDLSGGGGAERRRRRPRGDNAGEGEGGVDDEDEDEDEDDGTDGFQGGSGGGVGGISAFVSEEIKVNHMWAFHYSTALFFRRALCRRGGQRAYSYSPSLPSGQALVSKALEHLENVDALSSDIAIANTLWPGFIAAVEAVDMPLRHRALIWFARARRHGIGNIAKAKALVMEVWRRVDRQVGDRGGGGGGGSGKRRKAASQTDLGPVDWREVMREEGMYIMLT